MFENGAKNEESFLGILIGFIGACSGSSGSGGAGNKSVSGQGAPVTPVTFLYDKVQWHEFNERTFDENHTLAAPNVYQYGQAKAYCKSLSARLPTNREIATELANLSGQQVIAETAYSNVPVELSVRAEDIKDAGFRAEFTQMEKSGYKPSFNVNKGWVIEFYFRWPTSGRTFTDAISDGVGRKIENGDRMITGNPTDNFGDPPALDFYFGFYPYVNDPYPVICVK